MWLFYFKALHIIGFVSWFAGLFYLGRLFVYHAEAADKPMPDRKILIDAFDIMQWRLFHIIMHPAMLITWVFGVSMLVYNPNYLSQTWLQVKLLLLLLLTAYHFYCKYTLQQLKDGENKFSSYQFRLLNEVPTLFLVSIVLLAVLKNTLNFVYAIAGVFALGLLLVLATKWYKKIRTKQKNK